MKQLSVLIIALITVGTSFAQSDKYMKAMKTNVAAVDTVTSADGWAALANNFQRIADAEKTQWLPYYYASLGTVLNGMMQTMGKQGMAAVTDPLADKAEMLINQAEDMSKNNSEIFIVKKLIATLRLIADPQTRYQTYGPAAIAALATAKQLNPDNPRIYLLEGQDKYFTPEQFGGNKTEAKKLFEESKKKFETFKPASDIDPNWGKNQVDYFLKMAETAPAKS